MAWTSGFFNSVNGDRLYNADQMSKIFEGLITDGVYESVANKLAVQPNSGMTIQIATGRGWFGGRWVNNDSEYTLTVADSDVILNRYVAVCIKVDDTDAVRNAVPYLKYGEFASNPVKPTMERSETVKEYCLAYVYVKAGASEITAVDIEDTRGNAELCGWVTGLIKQVDATTLFTQFEAVFLNWFNNLDEYLDENVEAKLVNDVTKLQSTVLKNTAVISGNGWTDNGNGTYRQVVTVSGVTANSDIMVAPMSVSKADYIAMGCELIENSLNTLTFECTNPQSVDVGVELVIFNVNTVPDINIESVNAFTVTDDNNGNVTITA